MPITFKMASIFIRTLIIYALIAFSLRAMGKRQIGELEISELVSTLLISEIAALPIADPDIPFFNALIPVLLIFSLEIIISSLKNKSEKLKKIFEGEPSFLIYKGKLSKDALLKSRISVNELLSEARLFGIGKISEVEYAILEHGGKISFLKKSDSGGVDLPLIIDGEIKDDTLFTRKISKSALLKALESSSTKLDEIFLMTIDDDDEINIYLKEEK